MLSLQNPKSLNLATTMRNIHMTFQVELQTIITCTQVIYPLMIVSQWCRTFVHWWINHHWEFDCALIIALDFHCQCTSLYLFLRYIWIKILLNDIVFIYQHRLLSWRRTKYAPKSAVKSSWKRVNKGKTKQ